MIIKSSFLCSDLWLDSFSVQQTFLNIWKPGNEIEYSYFFQNFRIANFPVKYTLAGI
tara:strand:- start:3361 stop:3531 length:171 start_codon:yes stop_codon:yes gene_type:complete